MTAYQTILAVVMILIASVAIPFVITPAQANPIHAAMRRFGSKHAPPPTLQQTRWTGAFVLALVGMSAAVLVLGA